MPIGRPSFWISLIVLAAVLLRVGAALHLGEGIDEIRGGTYDQISYDALAQRVAGGHGFSFATDWWPNARAGQPTAFWSYPYTLFLAGVYAIAGHRPLLARLVQAVAVGLLMPWLIYRIGKRVFDKRIGLIAAGISAVYLYFVQYGAALMTESFYIVGILWTLDAAMRLAEHTATSDHRSAIRNTTHEGRGPGAAIALELGLATGFTLLMRQVIAGFLVVLAVWLLWVARRNGRLRTMVGLGSISVVTVVLLISPLVVRNYRAFGQLTMPNTNVGINFFWANHPIYGTRFEAVLSQQHGVSYQELIPPVLRDLKEPALDRALLVRGLQFVRDDPGRYLLLSLSRIPVYFQFWPTRDSSLLSNTARLLSFGLFLPFMVYGLVIALRDLRHGQGSIGAVREPPLHGEYLVVLLAYVVVYSFVHLASWANVRYRLPVDAVLILFAGRGIADLWRRIAVRWLHGEAGMPKGHAVQGSGEGPG
jgi:4-amino-4-deoxy-L-arabinose transferase-like glycosyltransferase